MIALMVGSDDDDVLEQAYDLYKNAKSIADLPAELRASILLASVRLHPEKVIDDLIELYDKSTADVQGDITSALTGVREAKDGEKIFSHMLGPKGIVRPQDLMRWLAFGLRNRHIRDTVWEYMKKHWGWIESTLQKSKSFDYLPVYAAGVGSTEEWLKEYEDFFGPKKSVKVLKQNISVLRLM